MLNELKDEAEKEKAETGEYIRPIMLLQAQPEYKDKASITVDQVKKTLMENFRIPPEEIAIAVMNALKLRPDENGHEIIL